MKSFEHQCKIAHVKLEVLSAVLLKIKVFWDVLLCQVVNGYQHFGGL